MKTRQSIITLLKEWLELTQLEAHAIQIGRWSQLTKIHAAKANLRQPLLDMAEQWRLENRLDSVMQSFRNQIHRLFDLESHTAELLAVRKRDTREKVLILEQTLDFLEQCRTGLSTEAA